MWWKCVTSHCRFLLGSESKKKRNESFGRVLLTMGNSVHELVLDRDFFNVLLQSSTIIASILT